MKNILIDNESRLANGIMEKALKNNFQGGESPYDLVVTRDGMITNRDQDHNDGMGWGRTFARPRDYRKGWEYPIPIPQQQECGTDILSVIKEEIKPNYFRELVTLAKKDISEMFRRK